MAFGKTINTKDKMVVYGGTPGKWWADCARSDGGGFAVDLGSFPTWRQAFDAAYHYAEAYGDMIDSSADRFRA